MIHQWWGPLVNLVGDGGYRAVTIGDWFVMKYANVLMYLAIAALFTASIFLHLPEDGTADVPGADQVHAADPL